MVRLGLTQIGWVDLIDSKVTELPPKFSFYNLDIDCTRKIIQPELLFVLELVDD